MRSEDVPGAHARGYNANSLGVCYEGGLDVNGRPADTRTLRQKEAMHRLVANLLQSYPEARVVGHRDLSPDKNYNGIVDPWERTKECPCFEVKAEWRGSKKLPAFFVRVEVLLYLWQHIEKHYWI